MSQLFELLIARIQSRQQASGPESARYAGLQAGPPIFFLTLFGAERQLEYKYRQLAREPPPHPLRLTPACMRPAR